MRRTCTAHCDPCSDRAHMRRAQRTAPSEDSCGRGGQPEGHSEVQTVHMAVLRPSGALVYKCEGRLPARGTGAGTWPLRPHATPQSMWQDPRRRGLLCQGFAEVFPCSLCCAVAHARPAAPAQYQGLCLAARERLTPDGHLGTAHEVGVAVSQPGHGGTRAARTTRAGQCHCQRRGQYAVELGTDTRWTNFQARRRPAACLHMHSAPSHCGRRRHRAVGQFLAR
mmetsp:Transcript_47196/g.131268  ORF Transcript_47196/g.131268 Transcript_47196/m.131268 type:complete len:224 (-) Transcript_47196:106-777(-)